MTTGGVGANPDGFLPALAANVMGLQEFAATTVEEWEAQLRSGVVTASSFLQAAIHQILGSLADFAEQIPLIGPLIAAAIMGFEGTLEDLGGWFSDLLGILGNPTGLGTGSPVIGALASIPLLGPIVTLVGQLIDAIVNALGFVGSGFSIATMQTHLGNLNTSVAATVSAINDLITGVSGAAIADVVTAINNGVTALTRIASLISGVTGASSITDVINAINAATTAFSALISGVAGSSITDVVTAITNATTNIQTLLNNLYNIFSGTTGNTGKTLANVLSIGQTFFTGAASGATQIAALISGLGGTVVADVVAVINAISAAIQALKNSLAGIFNPAGVGDISLSTLVTNIQTGLQGILPAIVQNANGTASVLSTAAITINNNGTATYNQVAGSVHALVDQANGTMATVSAALQAQAQAAIANAGSNLTAVAAGTQTLVNSLFGGFGSVRWRGGPSLYPSTGDIGRGV
jgi:hypothetical protein